MCLLRGVAWVPGEIATLQVNGGGTELDLVVQTPTSPNPTTTTIALPTAVNQGTAPTIVATVTPDPTGDLSPGPGTVQFYTNFVAMGGPVSLVTTGSGSATATATATGGLANLAPGTYSLYAFYSGSGETPTPNFSQSSASISLLATAGATESVVYYDNNGSSPNISPGPWDTTTPDWATSSALTTSTYTFPSGATAVTTSTGNNLLNLTMNSSVAPLAA